jgi:hypothetical protein
MSAQQRHISAAHPDDIDRAAGPSHGDKDFGGHDAEAEGAAKAGIGPKGDHSRPRPKQAPTDHPEAGEERAPTGHDGE